MPKEYRSIFITGGITVFLGLYSRMGTWIIPIYGLPTFLVLFWFVGIFLIAGLFIFKLAEIFGRNKKSIPDRVVPPIICMAFAVTALYSIRIGQTIGDDIFRLNIGKFERMVTEIKEDKIFAPGKPGGITGKSLKHAPANVIMVLKRDYCDNDEVIEFLIDSAGGAIGIHWGYDYVDVTPTASCTEALAKKGLYQISSVRLTFPKIGKTL